jgi:hypothetical protein
LGRRSLRAATKFAVDASKPLQVRRPWRVSRRTCWLELGPLPLADRVGFISQLRPVCSARDSPALFSPHIIA